MARSFQGSANLAGSVGGSVVQRKGRHRLEQLNQAGKLLRVLGAREELKPADDGGPEYATAKQPLYCAGFAFSHEVIDEDVRIGDRLRQFALSFRVRVNSAAASVSLMDPFSARTLRTAFARPP